MTNLLDLGEMASAGMSQADVEALAASGGGSSVVTGTDANGLPEVTGSGSPLVPNLPNNPTLAQQESAAMSEYNSDPALQAYIVQTYGYIGAYMLNIPELLPILVAAGLENWDQGQFDAAIVQTNWWKTTSQAQRNFQEIQSTNPGEAKQQIAQMEDTILSQAQSLGVTIPASQLANLAQFAVTFGWSTDDIDQALRSGGGFSTPSTSFGATATFADQARTLAGEYAINMSDAQLQSYVQQSVKGTLTADGLQNLFAQQAEQAYPWMAASIKRGVTPSEYLSSYASAAGKTLDVDPSSINWTDPKYMQALLKMQPNGQQAPVSVGEFQQSLMQNRGFGYQNTQGARDAAYATAQTILQTFGKVKQ